MRFAKWVFALAGASGILLVAPAYFLERLSAEFDPPALHHPEHYYGFVGIVLVYQLLYLLIATDPIRFRPVMLFGVLGKGSFAVTIVALFVAGRVAPLWLGFALFDSTWVLFFLAAYARTPDAMGQSRVEHDPTFHADPAIKA